MLVLSRKINQELIIGDNIRIKVLKVKGNAIRLGIEAPDDVRIVRGELSLNRDQPNADRVANKNIENVEASITVVRTDPNGPTRLETMPSVSPPRRDAVADRVDQDNFGPVGNGQPVNRFRGNDLLQQLVIKVAQQSKSPSETE